MVLKQSKTFFFIASVFVLIIAFLSMTGCDNQRRYAQYYDSLNHYADSGYQNVAQQEYEAEKNTGKTLSEKEIDEITGGEHFNEQEKKEPKKKSSVKTPTLPKISAPVFSSGVVQMVLIAALGILVAFIIYQVIVNRNRANVPVNNNISSAEVLDPEILSKLELNSLIQRYLNEKDYRMAVRMLYLQLLQKLFSLGHIMPSKEKTNYDFFLELSGRASQSEFGKLTRIYEEAWYADADVSAGDFNVVETRYHSFMKDLQ